MEDQLNVPLEDAELLAEVELTTNLIIAASESEDVAAAGRGRPAARGGARGHQHVHPGPEGAQLGLIRVFRTRGEASAARLSCPQESRDRGRGLRDLLVRAVTPFAHRVPHAVAEVVLDQADRHRLQRPGHRGDLGQDVDAVDVLVDHALQPPHLALDAPEPGEVVGLVVVVAAVSVTQPVYPHRV